MFRTVVVIGFWGRELEIEVRSIPISGTAADLAERGVIGIYPVVGWWRERSNLERWKESVRYSLVVSIATPRVDVDIYQPIAALIQQMVAVET